MEVALFPEVELSLQALMSTPSCASDSSNEVSCTLSSQKETFFATEIGDVWVKDLAAEILALEMIMSAAIMAEITIPIIRITMVSSIRVKACFLRVIIGIIYFLKFGRTPRSGAIFFTTLPATGAATIPPVLNE